MVTERKYTRKEFYVAFMNERAFAVSQNIPSLKASIKAIVDFTVYMHDALQYVLYSSIQFTCITIYNVLSKSKCWNGLVL